MTIKPDCIHKYIAIVTKLSLDLGQKYCINTKYLKDKSSNDVLFSVSG